MSSGRLVIVSNRVALPHETKPGGLAMAMQAALREHGGLWFGWNGNIVQEQNYQSLERRRSGKVEYVTMGLSQQDHDDYYLEFANRTLWPLLHFRPSLVNVSRTSLEGYLRVNEQIANRLISMLGPQDTIWVNDYHLMPLGAMLRERGVRCRIGFFLHTPLPPRELLVMLPSHLQVFGAMAAYDLVGFHTEDYAAAYRGYAENELGAQANGIGVHTVDGGRRSFRVGAFPVSIDTSSLEKQAARTMRNAAVRALSDSLIGRRLIIGADRLDYSKGLMERFQAYGHMLRTMPELRRTVTFLQIAPTSRGAVGEYRVVRKELERVAGHINGQYADADWVPIRYVNKPYQHSTLMGFYRLARVGFVTPLRDGMNLVAKEYVAAQDPDNPGVLVLSKFAGAARELTSAVQVNPHDIESTAECLRAALTMPLHERRSRWLEMMNVLRKYDISAWRNSFLKTLRGESGASTETIPGLSGKAA